MLRAMAIHSPHHTALRLGLLVAWLPCAVLASEAVPAAPLSTGTEVVVPAPTLGGMLRSLRQFLSEDDINALYLYLRDNTIASLTKQEPVEPDPELAFKLAVLEQRIKKEGGHYWNTVVLPELIRLLPEMMGPNAKPARPPQDAASK